MFGFLRGRPRDRTYHQIYATCCAHQRSRFGVESLPFVSYEALFLYQLAVDSGECPPPAASTPTCCRLGLRSVEPPAAPRLADFCTAFALLLASIKLEDDIQDEGSWLARLTRWRLRHRLDRTRHYFQSLDPEFDSRLDGILRQHSVLEHPEHRGITLQEYAQPTAEGFGYLFTLFGRLLSPETRSRLPLAETGALIGRAIIESDCAVDWEQDRQRGRFNPLESSTQVDTARIAAADALVEAGWLCADAVGPAAGSAGILRWNFDRLTHRAVAPQSPPRVRRRFGLQRHRLGLCDCPCDGGCCDACQGCDGCGCDGCPGIGHIGSCDVACCDCGQSRPPHQACAGVDVTVCCNCLDCCGLAGDCCVDRHASSGCTGQRDRQSSRTALKSRSANDDPGMSQADPVRGTTDSELRPSGIVSIGGRPVPARSERGTIGPGIAVEVIDENAFGVTVRPS